MNAADVIGYIVNGTYYCVACTPADEGEHVQAIFGDSETDAWSHCEVCEELIRESLTSDGVEYHLGRIREFLVKRTGRPEIVRQWATAIKHNFGSHEEDRVICELAVEACDEMLKGKEGG